MEERAKTSVVVDSTVSLTPALLEGLPLHVVPLELTLDGHTYRDGVDLTAEEFYARLPLLATLPRTSAPPPAAFLEAFRRAAARGPEALCITLSARLSSTYDSARSAVELARKELPGLRIELMDSETAAGAEALIALEAARAARSGASLDAVLRVARAVAGRVHFLGLLETLHYIWKGGHIPRVAMWATSLLQVKPLLDIHHGEVRLVERPRTRRRAIQRALEVMAGRVGAGPVHAVVMHAGAPEEAQGLASLLRQRFRCAEVLVVPFTPVIGAHTGPGLLGVAFYEEPPLQGPAPPPRRPRPEAL